MLMLPSTLKSKAICCPSGDQRGVPELAPARENSSPAREPSASLTQMPRTPLRLDSKTIRLPSGEYCGVESKRVEAMNRIGVPLATPEPDNERRHMLESMVTRWYAIRL